jgi:50S ribosomal protein L16 3-hydroxylase
MPDDDRMLTPDLSLRDFFEHYWRRRALLLPGAAKRFIDPPVSEEEARTAIGLARASGTERLTSDPGRTDFLRGADQEVPRLAQTAARLQRELGLPGLTFDIVQTHTAAGIGCHFDDTDNFIIQHSGTKIWRTGPVGTLPEDDHRRRLLRHAGYEWTAFLPHPEDVEDFVLTPGDVLYVPLYAPHWGTADGPSVSSPLVCDVKTVLEDLLPIIRDRLAADPSWWGPAPLTGRLPEARDTARLLSVLASPEFIRDITERWQADRAEAVAVHRRQRSDTGHRADPVLGRSLKLDISAMEPLFGPSGDPGISGVVNADPAALERLDALVSARNCKRMLTLAVRRFECLGDDAAADSVQRGLAMLSRLDPGQTARFVRGAELTGWLGLAQREHVARYRRTPDTLLGWLLALVLAQYFQAPVPSEAFTLDFPALPPGLRARVTADAAAAGFGAEADGRTVRFTPGPETTAGSGPPLVVTVGSWLHSLLPEKLRADIDPDARGAGATRGQAAVQDIEDDWPASLAVSCRATLLAIAPLRHGSIEKTRAIQEVRGLVVMRPGQPEEVRIGLWKALASTRFTDLSSLYRLAERPVERLLPDGRPSAVRTIDLLHQAFVSAWLAKLPDGSRAQSSASSVTTQDVAALSESGGLTEVGARLLTEIRYVLRSAGPVTPGSVAVIDESLKGGK